MARQTLWPSPKSAGRVVEECRSRLALADWRPPAVVMEIVWAWAFLMSDFRAILLDLPAEIIGMLKLLQVSRDLGGRKHGGPILLRVIVYV
jgi:hypothetical protein